MKKLIYIIIFICLIFGTNNYTELNNLAIITNIGIEKNKDDYKIIYQEIIPVKENDRIKNKYKYYVTSGVTINECLKLLNEKINKKIYLDHLENIIINTDDKKLILNLNHIFDDEDDNFNIFLTKDNIENVIKYNSNYKYINSIVDKKITYKMIKINKSKNKDSKIPVVRIKNKNLVFYKYQRLGDIND